MDIIWWFLCTEWLTFGNNGDRVFRCRTAITCKVGITADDKDVVVVNFGNEHNHEDDLVAMNEGHNYSVETEAVEMKILNSGIMLANGLGKHLEKSEFEETVQSLPKAIGSILNAVSPFIDRVLCTGSTPESTEIQFMRKMFKDMNLFFEKSNKEFENICNLIDWTKEKVPFEELRIGIQNVSDSFSIVCNVQRKDLRDQKDKFIQLFDSGFQNGTEKLYRAIQNPENQYPQSILKLGKTCCKNDRKNMQIFMCGILQMFLRSVILHLSYQRFQSTNITKEIDGWTNKIEQIRKQMKHLDDEIAKGWKEQCEADIEQLAKYYSIKTLDNNMFSLALYDKLNRKYFWRDWFVLVYKPLVGGDKHWVGVTDGHIKYRLNNRNIVVASVDQKKAQINKQEASEILSSMDVTKMTGSGETSQPAVTKNAHEVFDIFHSKVGKAILPYVSMGVIQIGSDVHYQCKPERFVHIQKDNLYDMHLFG